MKLYGSVYRFRPRDCAPLPQVCDPAAIFKFRTCALDIAENDPRWRWFRPCLLHSIHQCTGARATCASREELPQAEIRGLRSVLESEKRR